MEVSSLCDICPDPGACCRNLTLSDADTGLGATFWEDEGREAPLRFCQERNLPFEPSEIISKHKGEGGRTVAVWSFHCPKLNEAGRCSDYENRSYVCRNMQAGVSPLCILTPAMVK